MANNNQFMDEVSHQMTRLRIASQALGIIGTGLIVSGGLIMLGVLPVFGLAGTSALLAGGAAAATGIFSYYMQEKTEHKLAMVASNAQSTVHTNNWRKVIHPELSQNISQNISQNLSANPAMETSQNFASTSPSVATTKPVQPHYPENARHDGKQWQDVTNRKMASQNQQAEQSPPYQQR